MAKVKNYQPLFSTDLKFFRSVQMMEGKPIFDRYHSLEQVLANHVEEPFRSFVSYPVRINDRVLEFHGVLGDEIPEVLTELEGDGYARYSAILNSTRDYYSNVISSLRSDGDRNAAEYLEMATRYVDERFVYCYDGRVVLGAWGMCARENVNEPIDVVRKGLAPKKKARPVEPEPLPLQTEPPVVEEPPVEPDSDFRITFDAGEFGEMDGGIKNVALTKKAGEVLSPAEIPLIRPTKKYKFTGWNINPDGYKVDGDAGFVAMYEKKRCCCGNIWKWLLWILLALLLLLLLFFILRSCGRCHSNHLIPLVPPTDETGGAALSGNDDAWLVSDPSVGGEGGIYDPYNPYNPVATPAEDAGILPPQQGVMPPLGDDPVIEPADPAEPAGPEVIGNRLNILMENSDKSIIDLARAFKEKYPDDAYRVIYYDDVVKRLQISVPSDQRQQIKAELPSQFLPDYYLFVYDEALFEVDSYLPSDPAISSNDKSWYLKVIKAFEAWDITKGSENITVAVVDNGFNKSHPEISSKIIQPYNVWKHNTDIFECQEVDHGTHVAGTAVALADNGQGLCGVAPGCRLMPVQVADENGIITTTALVDGVLYAIYQGADVINLSVGCKLDCFSGLSENEQNQLIASRFKEEERLWAEIMRIASSHSSTVVFSAGNDAILSGIDPKHRSEHAIVVSATNVQSQGRVRASFSDYGSYTTISAPGEQIYSSRHSDDYEFDQGTSMAAPIVAGAVALMKSANDNLTTGNIITILQETGLPTEGNIGRLVQLDKAVSMAASGTIPQPTPIPSSGDVQILLSWNNYNDLDLICTDPFGAEVSYKNKRVPSGGCLEIDMNVEYPGSTNPVENIFWPRGSAPAGRYNVYVKFYGKHGQNVSSPYSVKVKYGNKVETYNGTMTYVSEMHHICSFILDNGASPVPSPGSGYVVGTPAGTTPAAGTVPGNGYVVGTPVGTAPAAGTVPGNGYVVGTPAGTAPAAGTVPGNGNTVDPRLAALEQERARLQREIDRIDAELRRLSNSR